jgi:hypothetical protein
MILYLFLKNTWEIHVKYMGNTCEIHVSKNTWEIHGKYMGNTCEIHVFEKYMGNTWEIHAKYMRNTLYCVTLYTNEVVLN